MSIVEYRYEILIMKLYQHFLEKKNPMRKSKLKILIFFFSWISWINESILHQTEVKWSLEKVFKHPLVMGSFTNSKSYYTILIALAVLPYASFQDILRSFLPSFAPKNCCGFTHSSFHAFLEYQLHFISKMCISFKSEKWSLFHYFFE